MKLKYLIIGLVISIGFTFCFVSCEAEDAVAERGVNLPTQDTTTSITTSETEEVIELIEEIDIYSDYTLADEFEFDDYNIEIYQCNNEEDNYQIDWRNKETDEITSVITGSSLLMVTSAGYVFEEIYDGENYKVHGYNQGELLLDIIVDEVDLNDERPMAINPQYRKNEKNIIEADFKLEMSDGIKKYKFSDYDGIVFGRYVRDFPMDEDVFISLVEEKAKEITRNIGPYYRGNDGTYSRIGGFVNYDNMLIDIDFDGIPELIQDISALGARHYNTQSYYNLSKGEMIRYNEYIDGIDSPPYSSILGSIFLKETADGNKTFYVDLHYSIGPTVDYRYYYLYDGIYMMDIEEFNIIYSPIAQTTDSNDNIVYKILDEKTGILIETNEAKYNKFVEEFKNTGCIDYLMTNKELYANYHITDESLDTYDPVLLNQMKEELINAAKEYIHLYKISEYTDPLEIEFDKQKFIDNMEKATEYFVENFEVPPLWCFLMDITSDGMPELFLPYPTNGAGSFQMYDISGDTIKFVASDLGTPTFRNYVNILTGKPVCVGEWQWIDYDNNYICTDTYEVITYSGDTFGQSHIIDDWWSPSGIYTNGMVRKNLTQIAIEKYSNNTEPNYQISKYINTTLRETEILERIAGKSENEYISVTKEEYETALSKYYSLLYEIELPYAEATQTGNVLDENEIRKVFAELTDAYIESCEIIAETQDEWLVFDIGND